jgi:hypothetical protein
VWGVVVVVVRFVCECGGVVVVGTFGPSFLVMETVMVLEKVFLESPGTPWRLQLLISPALSQIFWSLKDFLDVVVVVVVVVVLVVVEQASVDRPLPCGCGAEEEEGDSCVVREWCCGGEEEE